MVRWLVIIVAFALLAVGCGGSSTEVTGAVEQAEGGSTTAEGGLVPSGRAERVHDLAQTAIGTFGSDDAATEAVIGAILAGYDGVQIERGITSATLDSDGTIAGVSPVGPALEVNFRLVVGAAQQTQIERLRQSAQQLASGNDEPPIDTIERNGTELIIGLLSLGFTGEQIVEALILGNLTRGPLQNEQEMARYCSRRIDAGTLDLSATRFGSCDEVVEECRQSFFIEDQQMLAPICPSDHNDVGRVEPAVAADASAEEAPVPAPESAGGLVDSGNTAWSGDMAPEPDAPTSVTFVDSGESREFPVTYPEGFVEIIRLPGTDDFSISVDITTDSAAKYALSSEALQALLDADVINGFAPNYCLTSTNRTFDGVGSFNGDTSRSSYFIAFSGTERSVETRDCELEDLDLFQSERETDLRVEVTAEGLRVAYFRYAVVLPGSAAPLGG